MDVPPYGEAQLHRCTHLRAAEVRPARCEHRPGVRVRGRRETHRLQTTGAAPCCTWNTSSSPSLKTTWASSASQITQALSTIAVRTGPTSVGDEAITLRILALPVW